MKTDNPTDDSEPFTLARPPIKPPKAQPIPFENGPNRQRMLLCGLDCLSGQRDLFPTDGGPKREE